MNPRKRKIYVGCFLIFLLILFVYPLFKKSSSLTYTIKNTNNVSKRIVAATDIDKVRKRIVDHLTYNISREFFDKEFMKEFSFDEHISRKENGEIEIKQETQVDLGVKAIKLYKFRSIIPSSESINILIASRGRSGSSFIGDLLGHYPGTFYSYEPLHFLDFPKSNSHKVQTSSDEQCRLIKQVFQCTPSKDYIQHQRYWPALLRHNFRYSDACTHAATLDNSTIWHKFGIYTSAEKNACYLPDIYSSSCSLFPIRLIKTIRLPFELSEELLLDPDIGKTLKIIFLFRDPRGRLNSLRHKVGWCSPQSPTTNPCDVVNLCRELNDLVSEALRVNKKYPDQVYLVRYEDISINPAQLSEELLNFLDLPKSSLVQNFIKSHTEGNNQSRNWAFSTIRNSTKEAFEWRNTITKKEIAMVQKECAKSMKILGYNPIINILENQYNENYKLMEPLFVENL